MTVEDFNLTFMAGGYTECKAWWTAAMPPADADFKLYIPELGGATLRADGIAYEMRPGSCYLVNGHRGESRECADRMALRWVGFTPDSPYVDHLLRTLPGVTAMDCADLGLTGAALQAHDAVFRGSERVWAVRMHVQPWALFMVHGAICTVLATALRDHSAPAVASATILRLGPALDHIQKHYRSNLSLERLAERVGMAPYSFHRLFRQAFGTTPFEYIQRRRMNEARHLLSGSTMTIKEIATATGYSTPFYFSRAFRTRFGVSPSDYRHQAFS